ncbi:hypothetical protein C0Z20_15415 [Trinickia symbiotica]|uniref:Uncharacterized protein n=1 Tax=Trinickia symbiotica TaxID=863227 RepID=A0A2N7X384_9BURK|nr:hypothetical protein C0Z20_15415 [Trinickia symbiotica]
MASSIGEARARASVRPYCDNRAIAANAPPHRAFIARGRRGQANTAENVSGLIPDARKKAGNAALESEMRWASHRDGGARGA